MSNRKYIAYGGLFAIPVIAAVPFLIKGDFKLAGAGLAIGIAAVFTYLEYVERKRHFIAKWAAAAPEPKPKAKKPEEKPAEIKKSPLEEKLDEISAQIRKLTQDEPGMVGRLKSLIEIFRRVTPKDKRRQTVGDELKLLKEEQTAELERAGQLELMVQERIARVQSLTLALHKEKEELKKSIQEMQGDKAAARKKAQQLSQDVKDYRKALDMTDPELKLKKLLELEGKLQDVEGQFEPERIQESLEQAVRNCTLAEGMHKRILQTIRELEEEVRSEDRGNRAYQDIMASLDNIRKTVEETLVKEVRDQHAALTELSRSIDEFRFATRMFRISEITHERIKHEERAEELRLQAEKAQKEGARLKTNLQSAEQTIAGLTRESADLTVLLKESEARLARVKADVARARAEAEKNPAMKEELDRALAQNLDQQCTVISQLINMLNSESNMRTFKERLLSEEQEASAKNKARAEALEKRVAELDQAVDAGEREKEAHETRLIELKNEKEEALKRQKETIEDAARQELAATVTKLDTNFETERRRHAEVTAELDGLKKELATAKSEREEARRTASELEPQIRALREDIEQANTRKKGIETELNARISERDKEIDELKSIIGFLEAEYSKLLRVIKSRDREIRLTQDSVDDAQKAVEETKAKAAAILKQKITELKEGIKGKESSFEKRRKQYLAWAVKLRQRREELKKLNEQLAADKENLSKDILTKHKTITELRDKLTQEELQNNRRKRETEERIAGLERLKESLAKQNTQLTGRIEMLEELDRKSMTSQSSAELATLRTNLQSAGRRIQEVEQELERTIRDRDRLARESREVSQRLEQVERESKTADEAARAEIERIRAEASRHEEEYQQTLSRHDQTHGRIAELEHELEQRDTRLAQLSETILAKEKMIEEAGATSKKAVETLMQETRDAIAEERAERERAQQAALALTEKLNEYNEEVCFLNEHYDALVQELKSEISRRAWVAKSDLERHTSRARALEDQVAKQTAQAAQASQALTRMQSEYAQLLQKAGTLSEAEQRLQGISGQVRDKTAELERAKEALAVTQRDLQEARTDLGIENAALKAAKEEYDAVSQDIEEARQRLEQMSAPAEDLDTIALKELAAKERAEMDEFIKGLSRVQEKALTFSDEDVINSVNMIKTEMQKALAFAEQTKVPPIRSFLTKHCERMKLMLQMMEGVLASREEEQHPLETSKTQIFQVTDIIQMSIEAIIEKFPDIPEELVYDYDEARNLGAENVEAGLSKVKELSDKLDKLRRPVEEQTREVMHQGVPVKQRFAAGKDKQPSIKLDMEFAAFGQEIIKLKKWIIDEQRRPKGSDRSTQRLYVGRPDKVPVFRLVSGECGKAYTSEITQYESGLQKTEDVSRIIFNPAKGRIVFAKMSKKDSLADQKADVVITAKGDAEDVLQKISRKHFSVDKNEHGFTLTCYTYDGCPIIEEGALQWRMVNAGESIDLTNVRFIALDIEKRLVLEVSFLKTSQAEKSQKLDWYRIVMELKESHGKEQNFGYLELPRHASVMKGPKATGERTILLNRFFTNIGTDPRNNIRVEFEPGYNNLGADSRFHKPQELIDEFNTLISWEDGNYHIRKNPLSSSGHNTFVNGSVLVPGESLALFDGSVIHIGENEQSFFVFREQKMDPSGVATFENKHVAFNFVPNMDCAHIENMFGVLTCPNGFVLSIMDKNRHVRPAPGNRLLINKFGVTVGSEGMIDVIVQIDPHLKDAAGNSYKEMLDRFGFTINRHLGGKHTLTSSYKGGKVIIITTDGHRIEVPDGRTAILPDRCYIAILEEIGLTLKLHPEQIKNSEELSWSKAIIEMASQSAPPPTQPEGGLLDTATAILPPQKKSIWGRMKEGLSGKGGKGKGK
ncbi:hypothetical protein KY363_01895 [Candidatus Woesearchaeota archaeon]|nr:hypothetical protein [Candidatus Woesearchaeota archaeon]